MGDSELSLGASAIMRQREVQEQTGIGMRSDVRKVKAEETEKQL